MGIPSVFSSRMGYQGLTSSTLSGSNLQKASCPHILGEEGKPKKGEVSFSGGLVYMANPHYH